MPKIKNIIIFLVIGAVFVFIYFFYIKKSPDDSATLISSSETSSATEVLSANTNGSEDGTQDFLTLLLSVKNIKLDDTIFSDIAFKSLDGSHSITLTPDGTEGRPNPFAPLGTDTVVTTTIIPPTCTLPKVLDTATNTCITPPPTCTPPKVLNTSTNTCVNPPLN